jgi:hypothetical protein
MSTFISEPGTRLGGRYRLEDQVAAASGWAAWKAIDEILARAVTVVTFAPGFPRIREVVTAARAASRLTDARLAQVFDVEDDWDHAYIVMEWASGDTVDDLLSAGSVEPARGARIVAEAAAALSVAHAAGIAHLCLTPGSLRWTPGGGVKVTGLGIDAALGGITSEDPALDDTQGLGAVLYAVLTGHWPGPEYPSLPSAPLADGHLCSPRQVRAGVPAPLDDITCRALQLRGGEAGALVTPGQLATALTRVIPPTPLPPAPPPARAAPARREFAPGQGGYWADDHTPPSGHPGLPDRGPDGRPPRSRVRVGVAAVLVLIVMTGVVAAAASFLRPGHGGSKPPSASTTSPSASAPGAAVLQPVHAYGYDPLSHDDPGDENSSTAFRAIDASQATHWSTNFYLGSSKFGGLKSGTGLLLDMGKPVQLSSVTVRFGSAPGTMAQIEVGNSRVTSQAGLGEFTSVTSATAVSGNYTFTVKGQASGRYVLIWFTNLPPMAGAAGKFQADVFNVAVKGS